MFPFLMLGSVLCNFRVEFFWHSIKCDAVICGKDEFLFEPEAFLEFFDVGNKVNDLSGNIINKSRCFKPPQIVIR